MLIILNKKLLKYVSKLALPNLLCLMYMYVTYIYLSQNKCLPWFFDYLYSLLSKNTQTNVHFVENSFLLRHFLH